VVFRETKRLLRNWNGYEVVVRYRDLDGASVGSYVGGLANSVVASRRLRLHLSDGGTEDFFVWGAGFTAEAIESALMEWHRTSAQTE
jgi:hypothetical protein